MKHVLSALLAALFIAAVVGCATPGPEPEKLVVIAAPATAAPTRAPTMAPTAVPTFTPAPTPMIQADWYAARTEQMRSWMKTYGDYADDAAIEAQLMKWDIDPDRPMIALTFDDGPVHGVTDKILDILKEYDLRATFFVKGIHVEKGADLMQRAVAQGCEIGNHTWDHRILTDLSITSIRHEIDDANSAIEEAIGVRTHLLRPPGGSTNQRVRTAARQSEVVIVRWSQSGNVKLTDPKQIAATVLHQKVNGKDLCSGDIVLLHDTHDYMIEAVELMIPMILEKGYQLVTVSELLALAGQDIGYGWRVDAQYRFDNES